jgi:hypothetical protein
MIMKSLKKWSEISYRPVVLGISLFLMIYELARASRVAFTIDEATTTLLYLSSNIAAVFNLNWATNNHFLNTLLAKLFCVLAGNSEIVLRLPSLLGYGVYLLFSFLTLDRFIRNKGVVVCGFLLLNLNPYVLDYFSLCRGFGLSLGLMMPALFFFFVFLDAVSLSQADPYRPLKLSLVFASLAVLANISLFNVYLSLVIFTLGLFIVLNRKDGSRLPVAQTAQTPFPSKKIRWTVLTLLAVIFNLLVLSHHLALRPGLYEPVTVEITGLEERFKQTVQVFRVEVDGQEKLLTYENDVWTARETAQFTAIKFRCVPSLLDKMDQIKISIGSQSYAFDTADRKGFKFLPQKNHVIFYSPASVSLKRSKIPLFGQVINWKGDRIFLKPLFLGMLIIAGIAALFLLLIYGAGKTLKTRKVLRAEQFRPLALTTFWLATFLGVSLYVLKSAGAFAWGGTRETGFIRSTVYSLIAESFYAKLYVRGQEQALFLLVLLSILLFLISLIVYYRKGVLIDMLPASFLFVILLLSSLSTILQNILFSTPYLFQRTALFFIPLFMLFLIFLAQTLSRLKTWLNSTATILLVILAILASYHFYQTANTAKTADWGNDADTKAMLTDLIDIRQKNLPVLTKISLGIPFTRNPTLQYYLVRIQPDWLEVNVVPPTGKNDFYYLEQEFDSRGMILIKNYPRSGTILVKRKKE